MRLDVDYIVVESVLEIYEYDIHLGMMGVLSQRIFQKIVLIIHIQGEFELYCG